MKLSDIKWAREPGAMWMITNLITAEGKVVIFKAVSNHPFLPEGFLQAYSECHNHNGSPYWQPLGRPTGGPSDEIEPLVLQALLFGMNARQE